MGNNPPAEAISRMTPGHITHGIITFQYHVWACLKPCIMLHVHLWWRQKHIKRKLYTLQNSCHCECSYLCPGLEPSATS